MDIGSIKALAGPLSAPRPVRASVSEPEPSRAEASDPAVVAADATTAASKVEKPSETTREQVEGAVSTIQDFVQSVRRSINFSLEEGDGGRVVVKVTDAQSGDVIRQIPSEEALQLAENLSEVRSLLFKAEA